MKNKLIILIAGGLMVSLSSCLKDFVFIKGNGISATESRKTGMFSRVENSTSIDVIYKTADTAGITIQADENLIDYIFTETSDNTLEIKFWPGNTNLEFREKALITITSPRLEKAVISGSGAFLADEMKGDDVIVKPAGSGDISVNQVVCKKLTMMITGSGNVNINDSQNDASDIFLTGSGNLTLKGQCNEGSLKLTGSGQIHSESYVLNTATVIISGSGNTFTNVQSKLNAVISGSGNIYLKGNASVIKTISGSGRIILYQ